MEDDGSGLPTGGANVKSIGSISSELDNGHGVHELRTHPLCSDDGGGERGTTKALCLPTGSRHIAPSERPHLVLPMLPGTLVDSAIQLTSSPALSMLGIFATPSASGSAAAPCQTFVPDAILPSGENEDPGLPDEGFDMFPTLCVTSMDGRDSVHADDAADGHLSLEAELAFSVVPEGEDYANVPTTAHRADSRSPCNDTVGSQASECSTAPPLRYDRRLGVERERTQREDNLLLHLRGTAGLPWRRIVRIPKKRVTPPIQELSDRGSCEHTDTVETWGRASAKQGNAVRCCKEYEEIDRVVRTSAKAQGNTGCHS